MPQDFDPSRDYEIGRVYHPNGKLFYEGDIKKSKFDGELGTSIFEPSMAKI